MASTILPGADVGTAESISGKLFPKLCNAKSPGSTFEPGVGSRIYTLALAGTDQGPNQFGACDQTVADADLLYEGRNRGISYFTHDGHRPTKCGPEYRLSMAE